MIEFEKEESYLEGSSEGESIGIDKGRQQGILQSIRIHISSLREFQISDELILQSIIQKFQIPADEAEEFMKEQ